MEIGQKIRQLRKAKNLLQRELGAKIGVTAEAVSFWESNIRVPRQKQIKKLAKFFGITEAELFVPISETLYEVKETEIPIVCSIGPTDEFGNTKVYPFQVPYKTISFKNCKAMMIDSNSSAPVAYRGQKIIFSENESVKNGDLVIVRFRNWDYLFKRYYKNDIDSSVTLYEINPSVSNEPLILKEEEMEFCYKVIGVKF